MAMEDYDFDYAYQRERRQRRSANDNPRGENEKKDYMSKVVLVQVIVCAIMVLTAFGIKKTSETFYLQISEEYGKIVDQDIGAKGLWAAAKRMFSAVTAPPKSTEAGHEPMTGARSAGEDENESAEYLEALAKLDDETTLTVIDENAEVKTVQSSGGEDIMIMDAPRESTFAPVTLSAEAVLPVKGRVTSEFGSRVNPITGGETFHTGIDIAAKEGARIGAAYYGVVKDVGETDARGKYVTLLHGDGIETLYFHCSEILVEKGTVVRGGETVALVGTTGWSTGPHLHFELRINGIRCDPAWILADIK